MHTVTDATCNPASAEGLGLTHNLIYYVDMDVRKQ